MKEYITEEEMEEISECCKAKVEFVKVNPDHLPIAEEVNLYMKFCSNCGDEL